MQQIYVVSCFAQRSPRSSFYLIPPKYLYDDEHLSFSFDDNDDDPFR